MPTKRALEIARDAARIPSYAEVARRIDALLEAEREAVREWASHHCAITTGLRFTPDGWPPYVRFAALLAFLGSRTKEGA